MCRGKLCKYNRTITASGCSGPIVYKVISDIVNNSSVRKSQHIWKYTNIMISVKCGRCDSLNAIEIYKIPIICKVLAVQFKLKFKNCFLK